jgi:hypothetical protein
LEIYTAVYCTNCEHFRLDDEEKPYCHFEDICDIEDCKNSKSYLERPMYEERSLNDSNRGRFKR